MHNSLKSLSIVEIGELLLSLAVMEDTSESGLGGVQSTEAIPSIVTTESGVSSAEELAATEETSTHTMDADKAYARSLSSRWIARVAQQSSMNSKAADAFLVQHLIDNNSSVFAVYSQAADEAKLPIVFSQSDRAMWELRRQLALRDKWIDKEFAFKNVEKKHRVLSLPNCSRWLTTRSSRVFT